VWCEDFSRCALPVFESFVYGEQIILDDETLYTYWSVVREGGVA